jgi:tetratricopeptide (TPR) repeat protein
MQLINQQAYCPAHRISAMADKPSVFISYSHLDTEWKDRFVRHLNVSVKQGHFVQWNDEQIGQDWYGKISAAMDAASVGVFLISADFLGSDFILREEVTRLIERREREGLHIVPVYLRKCDWEAVEWLARMQIRPAGDRPVVRGEEHIVDDEFADLAKEIRLLLEKIASERVEKPRAALTKPPDLSRLPQVGEHLFGRERELALLDGAWADEETNLISLVAWGGVGKSALVKHWLGQMARERFRGAARIYGWSFFSQGATEGEASADDFFDKTLRWFGELKPERFQQTERAGRLTELIQQQRTLLVLDGLEPLQHPPGPQEGKLKDQTLAELLRLLAWQNPGLVVITTRLLVDDVRDLRSTTAPMIELGHLSPQAGAQLLQVLGVEGEQEELEAASREFGGHGLALNLLGTYLRDVLDGDVRRRNEVSLLEEDEEQGGQARRIMRSYEKQLGDSPEIAVLQLIGLFDRPAKRELIYVLRQPPAVEGLNNRLVGQSEHQWQRTLARLKRSKLLSEETPDALDAHPLVREHFGARLKAERPKAWRAGHARLYEHLRDDARELPDTLAEMAPLFQAMHHGCQAQRYDEAVHAVYWARIQRGEMSYASKKLGAIGAELAALAGLFDLPWTKPVATLAESAQAFILNEAGYYLRSLGRLREAVAPMRAGLERYVAQEAREYSAQSARNLSELHLLLGEVAAAVALGEASVAHADRGADAFMRIVAYTTWADALRQAGESSRAQALFEDMEALQVKYQPGYPRLYSLPGYRYCDLLFDLGRADEVRQRAEYAFKIAEYSGDLGSIALDHLALGRAALVLGEHREARAQLDDAIDHLRRASMIHHIPRVLLARAALFQATGDFSAARRGLDEAMRIARRSEMRLFQCDAHLGYARLALAEGDKDQVREHVAAARRLVDETGYGRRRPEVEELEAELR